MEKILSISLRLNFIPNTLGCYALINHVTTLSEIRIQPASIRWFQVRSCTSKIPKSPTRVTTCATLRTTEVCLRLPLSCGWRNAWFRPRCNTGRSTPTPWLGAALKCLAGPRAIPSRRFAGSKMDIPSRAAHAEGHYHDAFMDPHLMTQARAHLISLIPGDWAQTIFVKQILLFLLPCPMEVFASCLCMERML